MERQAKALLVVLIISVFIGSILSYQYGRESLLPELQQLKQELQRSQERIQEIGDLSLELHLLKQELQISQDRIQELEQEIRDLQTPLEISDIKVANKYLIIHDQNEEDNVTIEWNTNFPADSKIELYIDDERVNEEYIPEFTTKHKIILPSWRLEPGTTYYFRVSSTDASGKTAISKFHSFSTPWTRIFFTIPRSVREVSYSQTVEGLTITTTLLPSGVIDFNDYGNSYKLLYWNKEQSRGITFWETGWIYEGALNISFTVIITREVNNTLVENSDYPYPIPEDELPEEIKAYLQPSNTCQADAPEIISLAQNLSQGYTREIEVVSNTVSWVSENIERGICGEIEYEDALSTLKYRKGVCRHFTRLTCALLRAQGIPARLVMGIVVDPNIRDEVTNPVPHMWLQVYYPDIGWVNYDPFINGVYGLSNYIELEVSVPPSVRDELYPYIPFLASWTTKGRNLYSRYHIRWKGLGENKIEYTFSFNWKVSQEEGK